MNRSLMIKSIAGRLVRERVMIWLLVGFAAAALAPLAPALWRYAQSTEFRPHAPDWPLFLALPLAVKTHLLAALFALGLGLVILALPKGRGPHKLLGWIWVAAMAATAVSSLFITGLNGDRLSVIHLLTGWTMIALPMGVYAIRTRQVVAHRRRMTSIFIGGLVIAGALTFVPGRFMFEFLFG